MKSDDARKVEEEEETSRATSSTKNERKSTLIRIISSMIVFTIVSLFDRLRGTCLQIKLFQIISLLSTCLVITGSEEADFEHFYDVDQFSFEKLPEAEEQLGPEARNYVAYIPVPINEGEDEDDDDEVEDDVGVGDDDDCYANSLCRWLSRCTKERREQALLVSPRV